MSVGIGDASFPNIETISQSVSTMENETSKSTINNVIDNHVVNVVEANYNINDPVHDKKVRDRTLNELYEIRVKINDNQVDLLLDTGTSHSLLKASKAQVALGKYDVTLISATGDPIMVKGTTNVTLGVNDKYVDLKMIVVDDMTKFSYDGILGIDFLRKTNAIIDLKRNKLDIDGTCVKLRMRDRMERNKINIITSFQVDYHFPNETFEVRLNQKETFERNSQRLVHVQVIDPQSQQPPPTDQCYVTTSKSLGRIPLVVARSVGQLSSGNCMPVLVMNPSDTDIHLDKGICITKAELTPMYQRVIFANDKKKRIDMINMINEIQRNKPIERDDIEVDEVFEAHKDDLVSLLNRYRNNVSLPGEPPGRTKLIKHKICLDTPKPLYTPQYRVAACHQNALDQQIEEMLQDKVIRESKSPYNSPLVIVPKPDGSIRPCVDFRNINSHVIPDRFPLPILGEVLQSLAGNKVFSTLDCQSGFWQVELEEDSKKVTAFSTRKGHFEYNVLPFGLKDAAPSFERMITMTLSGLINNSVLVYLDDVIVFSEGPKEHLQKLQQVLERFKMTGLTLKLKKCTFMRSRVKYLGHLVSHEGVQMDPGKTDTIRAYKAPDNKDALRSFLGLMSYYRAFIPAFSATAQPLLQLLKKNQPYKWNVEQEDAFQSLKKLLLEAPILKYPNFQKTFFLATDASDKGLGAALLQEHEGKLHPVSYASRTLNKAECNYYVTKKEALAVVWALRNYKYVILGYPVVVITDHKPLLALFRKAPPDALMNRWMVLIQEYQPLIRHIPGKQNVLADVLSRNCDVEVVSEGQAEDETLVEEINLIMSRDPTTRLWSGTPWQDENIALEQQRDDYFGPIVDKLQNQCSKSNNNSELSTYFLDDSILYKFVTVNRLGVQMKLSVCCIPSVFLGASCMLIHQHSNHAALERCLLQANKLIYNPKLQECLNSVIKECSKCLQNKARLVSPPLHHVPIARTPFEVVAIDFLGPVPVGAELNKYILVMVDQLTRYIVAVPTVDRSADTVVAALQKHIFAVYNVPSIILSDNAREFVGEVMHNVAKVYGIELRNSTPYHPQGNGLPERSVRKVLQALRTFCEEKATWDLILPELVARINSTFNISVSDTPHFCLYGFDRRTPFSNQVTIYNEEISGTNSIASTIKQAVYEAVSDTTASRIIDRNIGKIKDHLAPGQRCFVHRSALPGSYDKLDPKLIGPFVIKEPVSVNSYKLIDPTTSKERILHRDKLIAAGSMLGDGDCEAGESGEEQQESERKKERKQRIIPSSDRVLRSMTRND